MLKYFTVVLIGLALMLVATPASAQEGGDDAAAAASGSLLFGSSLGGGWVMVGAGLGIGRGRSLAALNVRGRRVDARRRPLAFRRRSRVLVFLLRRRGGRRSGVGGRRRVAHRDMNWSEKGTFVIKMLRKCYKMFRNVTKY